MLRDDASEGSPDVRVSLCCMLVRSGESRCDRVPRVICEESRLSCDTKLPRMPTLRGALNDLPMAVGLWATLLIGTGM